MLPQISKAIIYLGKHFLLQYRDDEPEIAYPNQWTFLGGEIAARYITELTDTSDVVTTGIYSSANLRYYLDKLNSTTKLTWSANEMASSRRIVIVVNTIAFPVER